MYTVREAATLTGISEHTLRYYTDLELVPTVRRDKNNNRQFDEESINWLRGIKCLRACGMPLEAIRDYCALCRAGDVTIEARYAIILEQLEAAKAQLVEAQKRVEYLQCKAERYQDIIRRHAPDDMNPSNWPAPPAR